MSFPYINRQPTRSVGVPELSGGVNLRDSISTVGDNQLTDAKNMWYRDGQLVTRPRLRPIEEAVKEFEGENISVPPELLTMLREHGDIKILKNNKWYKLYSFKAPSAAPEEGEEITLDTVRCTFASGDDRFSMNDITVSGNIVNHFTVLFRDALYVFVCYMNTTETPAVATFEIYKGNIGTIDTGKWTLLTNADMFAPLVMINGDMNGATDALAGDMINGFNLLGNGYKAQYNADSTVSGKMWYRLVEPLPIFYYTQGQTVSATFTKNNGMTVKYSVIISTLLTTSNPYYESAEVGGTKMRVYADHIEIVNSDGTDYPLPDKFKGRRNNLEILSLHGDYDYLTARINLYLTTISTWFGGASAGINGGTRLFVSGNLADKSLVRWSALDNPLYFPMDNYFYVGDSSQAVTAFGKQGKMLVIFKEREIYYTYYSDGLSVDASSFTEGGQYDLEAISATFPLVQIHGKIGCDCADTVQLCLNRLVWASSDGHIYTLTANDQYSELNVYEVGQLIERRLMAESPAALKGALSADFDGHYFLFVGRNVYVADYSSHGFRYPYSYQNTERSNAAAVWYIWELPNGDAHSEYVQEQSPVVIDTRLIFFTAQSTEDSLILGAFRGSVEESYYIPHSEIWSEVYSFGSLREADTEKIGIDELNGGSVPVWAPHIELLQPIESVAQTKIFDFGMPQYNKKIPLVNVSFGNNDGAAVTVKFVTAGGVSVGGVVRMRGSDTEEYSPGYTVNKPIRPNLPAVSRFGVRFECQGKMAIDSMSINYTINGGAR